MMVAQRAMAGHLRSASSSSRATSVVPATWMEPAPTHASSDPTATPRPPPARSLRELEKQGIIAALAATGGNKAQAAAILEIDRSPLYQKLKDHDIEG